MKRDPRFERYLNISAFLSLVVPGLGQLVFLHWSFAVWFLGAIAAYYFLGMAAGIAVHLLCFFHASVLHTNIMKTIRRHGVA